MIQNVTDVRERVRFDWRWTKRFQNVKFAVAGWLNYATAVILSLFMIIKRTCVAEVIRDMPQVSTIGTSKESKSWKY
jgi:hypothetical protein